MKVDTLSPLPPAILGGERVWILEFTFLFFSFFSFFFSFIIYLELSTLEPLSEVRRDEGV